MKKHERWWKIDFFTAYYLAENEKDSKDFTDLLDLQELSRLEEFKRDTKLIDLCLL